MRSFLLAIVLSSLVGCAHSSSGAKPINVHAVRMEIKGQIEASPGDAGPRQIVSMGKVRADSAVVYTERPGQPRREETWVRGANGWTLSSAVAIEGTPAPTAN